MSDDLTPLAKLEAAVQEFAVSQAGTAVHVVNSIVVWEQVRFDGETTLRAIRYTCPSGDGASMAGALGLNEAAGEYLRRDALGLRTEDDD